MAPGALEAEGPVAIERPRVSRVEEPFGPGSEVDPADYTRYRLDDKWVSFEPWPQTFKWGKGKSAEQRSEIYRVSYFGPLYNAGREDSIAPGKTYALHWSAFASHWEVFGAVLPSSR